MMHCVSDKPKWLIDLSVAEVLMCIRKKCRRWIWKGTFSSTSPVANGMWAIRVEYLHGHIMGISEYPLPRIGALFLEPCEERDISETAAHAHIHGWTPFALLSAAPSG